VRRHAGTILRVVLIVVILVALAAFARTIEWRETWRAMRSASLVVLAIAAVINLSTLGLKAARWWIFLRPIGVRSFWLALRATLAGAALNNILIANTGDAARVVHVARAARAPSASVLATLALERLFDMTGYVVVLALTISFLGLPPALEQTRPFAVAALVLMVGLLVYLARHPETTELTPQPGEGLFHRVKDYGRRFARTVTRISTPGRFMVALLVSVLAWVTQVATYELTAQAARFDIPVVGTIAAMLAVNLGFAIRATPANVGVFQMMYAMIAVAFGMDKDQAIGVALLIQAQQVLPVTILGLAAAPEILAQLRGKSTETTKRASLNDF
jgi:uncharacterized protein (TIRG00374 family)